MKIATLLVLLLVGIMMSEVVLASDRDVDWTENVNTYWLSDWRPEVIDGWPSEVSLIRCVSYEPRLMEDEEIRFTHINGKATAQLWSEANMYDDGPFELEHEYLVTKMMHKTVEDGWFGGKNEPELIIHFKSGKAKDDAVTLSYRFQKHTIKNVPYAPYQVASERQNFKIGNGGVHYQGSGLAITKDGVIDIKHNLTCEVFDNVAAEQFKLDNNFEY
jgi:hypothetical protein